MFISFGDETCRQTESTFLLCVHFMHFVQWTQNTNSGCSALLRQAVGRIPQMGGQTITWPLPS